MNYYEINLAIPVKSNCEVKIDTYPDSQVSATIPIVDPDGCYTIKSRFSNYQDLFKIVALNSVLRDFGVAKVKLYCPYILAARSDRRFKDNQSFDLKLVTDVLNSCKFDEITIMDPHSDVLPALLNRIKVVSLSGFGWESTDGFWSDKTLISPDAGAYKKVFKFAEALKIPVIAANKVRTSDGVPEIQFHGDVNGLNCVIMDDICDGGRTFETLGKQLKELGAATVTLMVTHGIFSKGTKLENVDMIYTTNSFKNFIDNELHENFKIKNIF